MRQECSFGNPAVFWRPVAFRPHLAVGLALSKRVYMPIKVYSSKNETSLDQNYKDFGADVFFVSPYSNDVITPSGRWNLQQGLPVVT